MARNPVSGRIYVTNTESPNLTMFEGPGISRRQHRAGPPVRVAHHGAESVERRRRSAAPEQAHQLLAAPHRRPGANHAAINAQAAHSLATPLQPVVSSDGATLYVPAFGSSKIGVFSTAAIEDANFETNFNPTTASANYITTTGGGPPASRSTRRNNRLYVLTRFDNTVHVINPTTKATRREPRAAQPGARERGHGSAVPLRRAAHVGQRRGVVRELPHLRRLRQPGLEPRQSRRRDLVQHAALGDAVPAARDHLPPDEGPDDDPDAARHGHARRHALARRPGRPGSSAPIPATTRRRAIRPCNEDLSFRNFIVAFEGLVGKQGTITGTQMQQFSDFILQVFEPPNPVRPLNNTLTGSALAGQNKYFTCGGDPDTLVACPTPTDAQPDAILTDTVEDCDGCHNLNPGLGFFGSGGEQSFEGEPQNAKVPHYRNMYTKIGMFSVGVPLGSDQVRGFGFLHDGAIDTLRRSTPRPCSSTARRPSSKISSSSRCSPRATSRRSSASR